MTTTIPMPAAVRAILRPREQLTVSQWCDRYRYLSRRFTAEPGFWRTARLPYLREPLDSIDDPDAPIIDIVKAARTGGTETINNAIAHTIDQNPLPIMYVQPTKEDVEDEFDGRLRQMILDSPRLADHIHLDHWATQHRIRLDSLDIYGAWPTNPQTMVRKTIGFVVFDEVDNAEAQAGYLGNSLKLLIQRIDTFEERGKVIVNGSPTTEDAAGWQTFLLSDQRRYHVPCPHCGHYQILNHDRLISDPAWLAPDTPKDQPSRKPTPDEIELEKLARYPCVKCSTYIIYELHHAWMIARGVWLPRGVTPVEPLPLHHTDSQAQPHADGKGTESQTNPSARKHRHNEQKDVQRIHHGGHSTTRARRIIEIESLAVQPPGSTQWTPRTEGTPPATRIRGYHLGEMLSPFRSKNWHATLAEWFRVQTKPEEKRVFVNATLGRPWTDTIKVPTWQDLAARRTEGHDPDRVPASGGVKLLIMGADVQEDTIHYLIWGYAPFETTYLIREGTTDSFDTLYHIAYYTGFPITDARGPIADTRGLPRMRCSGLAIDAGYTPRRPEVDKFSQRPGVTKVKGQGTDPARKIRGEHTEPVKRSKLRPDLFMVGTDFFKAKFARALALPLEHDGAVHLHHQVTDECLQQLTSEVPKRLRVKAGRNKGRTITYWALRAEGQPNHKLDCRIYADALAELMGVPLLRDDSPRQGLIAPPSTHIPKGKPPPKKGAAPGDPGGFIG